jgi:hypothetical protein
MKDEAKYGAFGAGAREAGWIDALAYQYGKTLFVGKVWLEQEGVTKSMTVE